MERPFSHDKYPKLSDCIRRVVESHPHSKLTGLGVSELRKLECKYATKAARGDANAERELEDIRGILKGKRIKESNGSLGALKKANAADLKEYPGKRGEAAHKRLHKTIGKFLKGKGMKESLDAVNERHGGALERMDEAALKASSDTLRKKYDRHEGDVISHMDYSGRRPGSPVNTPHTQRRMGRKHTAMALIKREMGKRGEKVGYQPPKSSPEFIARQEKEREQERAQARREREQRESNPVYQRNVAKYKEFLAKRDANRKARRGG
jgi:hypothetical protein